MFGLSPARMQQKTVLVRNVKNAMTDYTNPQMIPVSKSPIIDLITSNTRTLDLDSTDKNGLTDISRAPDAVFQNEIPVIVRDCDNTERRKCLSVTILDKQLPASHSKEIHIQVTDAQDPFFFYSMRLAEEDFQNLKVQQGLLVDFASFPAMLVQLLDKCLEESRTDSPKFILVLNNSKVGNVTLDFTELNFFKHLCHLSLIIVKASDSQLKDYLADCIKKLTSERNVTCADMKQTITSLQNELTAKGEAFDTKTKELEALKRKLQEESTTLEQKLVQGVAHEKERCSSTLAEIQARYDRERRESEHRQARTVEQLENRVASLDVQNKDLTEVKYRYEASLRELRAQHANAEEQAARLKIELAASRKENCNLDAGYQDRDRRTQQLTTRIAVLEQELQDKARILAQQQELVRSGQEHKQRIDAELREKESVVLRRETAVRNVTEELMKANDIIRKLQEQIRQQQAKVKLRSQIATEQEKVLGSRDGELADVREQLKKSSEELAAAREEVDNLLIKAEDRNRRVEELDKMIRTNENVINWLNKQLSSAKSPGFYPEGNSLTAPTPTTTMGCTSGFIAGRGKVVASGRGGRGVRGGNRLGRLDEAVGTVSGELKNKETGQTGLDPKYFTRTDPEGMTIRQPIPTELPSNVIKGKQGLLRKPLNQKKGLDGPQTGLAFTDTRT